MTEYAQITVDLDEPVAAGRNLRSDHRRDIHDHIPGSVLRGAIAAAWIDELGLGVTKTPEFAEIFDGEGSFGPLHSPVSYPVPLSVAVHKYGHGDDCQKLWWDEALGDNAVQCDRCKQELVPSKGQSIGKVEVRSRTMTALHSNGVARDGNLFSESALADGMRLRGWLHGPAVRALESADVPLDALYLGSRRSLRGSAAVRIDRTAVAEPVELTGKEVILRLAAPGIFVDRFGMPHRKPDRRELEDVLGVKVKDVTAEGVKPWTRWTEAGGWHAASKLPKPTERAVAAGSTFRVRCTEPPAESARRALTARGVGLRRREGFGALYVPTAPMPPRRRLGEVAALASQPQLVKKLEERARGLRLGRPDDTPFEADLRSDQLEEHVERALRNMLRVSDPATYDGLVEQLGELCAAR